MNDDPEQAAATGNTGGWGQSQKYGTKLKSDAAQTKQ
jgi:hypothetical protein